jgi:hypothetical protein
LQWLQDPSETHEENLKNTRREAYRHFRNIKGDCLKQTINDLAKHSKKKNIINLCWGINEFKNVWRPRTGWLNNENGDLLAHSHNISNRWKNYFSQLLNVHRSVMLGRYKYSIFRQDRFKQELKYYFKISTKYLILRGIRINWLSSGRSILLYQFKRSG